MNQEKLKSISTEDLEKKLKQTKLAIGILTGVILCLYILSIYNTINDGKFDYTLLVAIAFTFTIVSSFRQTKGMEKEIKSREIG